MKNGPFSHLKPRGINILNGELINLNTPESINTQMLDNNQCDVIVKYNKVKLTPKIIELVTNELHWIDQDDELWAINTGDTDIKIVNGTFTDSVYNIVQTLVLARNIFIIDGNESSINCYKAEGIKKGLLDYQAAIQKAVLDNCFEGDDLNDLNLSEEEQEIKDYEDDIMSSYSSSQIPASIISI